LLFILLPFMSLAPWYPTRDRDFWRIKKAISLQPTDNFLEVWCGTAKVSLFLGKEYPSNQITWIEFSLIMYIISRIKVHISGLKNVTILYWNALKVDFSKYDVVYVFGMPETLRKKLFPKLKQKVNNNFRLISYCFPMKNDFFEEKIYSIENRNSIYEYRL
jgi:16S rRNA A1518/A1519 N6-dimethyltransferase RsmA/KsgA/DIM1 with predicted DNA glycosylase/AP lyase activity